MGSTSYITDAAGEVYQHLEYFAFGETFVEEHSNTDRTPYLFNGKERDEETGLYYYGARYYEAQTSVWLSVDPMAEKYSHLSPYVYVSNKPINAIDPDGKRILFVNGHWQKGWLGKLIGSNKPKKGYWGSGFAEAAQKFFNDKSVVKEDHYIDGSSSYGGDSSGKDRFESGYKYAEKHLEKLTADLEDGETFKIVTHSEGGAYGAGVAEYLIEKGYDVEQIIHLSADEGDEFTTPEKPNTTQFSYEGDWVTGNKKIEGVDSQIIKKRDDLGAFTVHGTTKGKQVFSEIKEHKTNEENK